MFRTKYDSMEICNLNIDRLLGEQSVLGHADGSGSIQYFSKIMENLLFLLEAEVLHDE